MIEILNSPDQIGAYKLSGTLSEDDVDRVVADIEAKLARYRKIGIVADLTGFHDVTLRAGVKDLRYSFGKIFEWNRFSREAVITDKQWLKTLLKMTGPLIPFVELRAFEPGEQAAAMAWVEEAVSRQQTA